MPISQNPQTNRVNNVVIDASDIGSIERLVKRLNNVRAKIKPFMQTAIQETSREINETYIPSLITDLRIYPPKPPGSRYKRTYKLRYGWTARVVVRIQRDGGFMRLQVTNTVRYRPYVQGLIGVGTSRSSLYRYIKPIRKYHLANGWQPAAPIISVYNKLIERYALNSLNEKSAAIERFILRD